MTDPTDLARAVRTDAKRVIADWWHEADLEVQRVAMKSHERRIVDFDVVTTPIERGARSLLNSLAQANPPCPYPYIYPTRRGTIQFEWEQGPRYFEIEVRGERAAEWYYRDRQAHEERSGEVFELEPLDEVLELIRHTRSLQ